MLGKLILLLVQIAVAFFLAPVILANIPVPAAFGLFAYAVVYAILVYLTGVLGAMILRGVGAPSSETLGVSLTLAIIVAAVLTFAPDLIPDLPRGDLSNRGLVLAGAILGYMIKR